MKYRHIGKRVAALSLAGVMLLPGFIVHAEETAQVMVEAQETVIQDAEKPEDAVKVEVRLDLGDGILREGVNAFHLKVENISNRSVAVSGQVCVTAKAKTWSDTGEASNLGSVSSLAPTGPMEWGAGIEVKRETVENWLAKGEELSDPAEYFLQAIVEVTDQDGKKGNAVHEIPVQIKLDEMTFGDVKTDHWYYDYVKYVYDNGLMTGLDKENFGPADVLARAQFAVILHRMNGEPIVEFDEVFPDVYEGEWYTDAILWASSNGIVTGYTDSGLFGTADNINREQMAVMMYRYAKYKGYDVTKTADFSQFEDAANVSGFAEEAMRWAVGTGIITGKDEGTRIDPQGNAARAECAAIIKRFVEIYN